MSPRAPIALACVLAFALPSTAAAQVDPRIQSRLYNAAEVVELRGRVGVQATIAFADDEQIENIAVGDSAEWQVTPNKRANLLFVKPVAPNARTNMTVVTDRRTYLFDLVAGGRGGTPVYALRFTYPAEAKPVGEKLMVMQPAPEPVAAAPTTDPALLNFAWSQKGDRRLAPQRLFDDGTATYIAFAPDATLPAILQRDAKGNEGPVNYSIEGDYTVVDGVPALLVLRAGRAALELTPTRRATPPARTPAPLRAAAIDPAARTN